MFPAALPLAHWLHGVGFSVAMGSAIAVTLVRRSAARSTVCRGAQRALRATAELIAKVEIPGLVAALFAGIMLAAINPASVDPAGGAWMIAKLPLVMIVAVIAFMNLFGSTRLLREREQGAGDAELEPLLRRGGVLDLATLILFLMIFFVAHFRFAFYG